MLLLVAGCAEEAVEENLLLELANDGSSVVRFEVELAPTTAEMRQPLVDRLSAVRFNYLEGLDPWADRFATSEAVSETLEWSKDGGELVSLRRTAVFDDPDGLERFFADTDLTVHYLPSGLVARLSIYTRPSTRGTAAEEEWFEARISRWGAAVSAYFAEVESFFDYLGEDDVRAARLFNAIFTDFEQGVRPHEEARVERLIDSFVRVLESAERQEGDAFSLEELTRLLFDPMPARLTVAVEGEVVEIEGFEPVGHGEFEAPRVGLEQALTELERVWVEPPLLTTYALQSQDDSPEFDARAFAARPRSVADVPSAEQVLERLEDVLTPPGELRIRWEPPPNEEETE